MPAPHESEFPAYFTRYISKIDADQSSRRRRKHAGALLSFYTGLPDAKGEHAYGPGNETIKEVIQHVIDAERVFSYRIMCIARQDKTSLPCLMKILTQNIHRLTVAALQIVER